MTKHIDHKINWAALGICMALLGNMAAGIWYASGLSSRVELLEQKTQHMQQDKELLVRIDERIRLMAENINEIKKDINIRKYP